MGDHRGTNTTRVVDKRAKNQCELLLSRRRTISGPVYIINVN